VPTCSAVAWSGEDRVNSEQNRAVRKADLKEYLLRFLRDKHRVMRWGTGGKGCAHRASALRTPGGAVFRLFRGRDSGARAGFAIVV